MKPVLTIAGGRLRPARSGDLDWLVGLLHRAEVRRFLCDDQLLPRADVAGILERSDRLDPQGLGLWVVEDLSEACLGVAGLEPVSDAIASAPGMAGGVEPLVALAPEAWGQGLATSALTALTRHARQGLALSRLVGAVDAPNAASLRMMARAGFRAAGRLDGPAGELVLFQLDLSGGE